MKTLELRLEGEEYVIVNNGNKSSTTFSAKFRLMAINKFKFLAKNTVLPLTIKVDDARGKEIINMEVKDLSEIDKIN